jgi:hypothetical protein
MTMPQSRLRAFVRRCVLMLGAITLAVVCPARASAVANQGPVIEDTTVNATTGILTTFTMRAWDPEGDPLTWFPTGPTSQGGLLQNNGIGGALKYTSSLSTVNMTDTGTVAATDFIGSGLSATGTVTFLVSVTSPPATPTAPSGLAAGAITNTTATMTWTDNSSNETQFKIERNDGSGFHYLASVAAGVTTFTDTLLLAGTAYSYRVRAYGAGTSPNNGNSGYTATITVTTTGTATTTTTGTGTSTASAGYGNNPRNNNGKKCGLSGGAAAIGLAMFALMRFFARRRDG